MHRNSDFTSKHIDRLFAHPAVTTRYGDMVDLSSLHTLLVRIRPTEIYNLAAQSHVQVSFNVPLDAGTLRGFCRHRAAKNEMTPFMPRAPYTAAKLFAYWTVCN